MAVSFAIQARTMFSRTRREARRYIGTICYPRLTSRKLTRRLGTSVSTHAHFHARVHALRVRSQLASSPLSTEWTWSSIASGLTCLVLFVQCVVVHVEKGTACLVVVVGVCEYGPSGR
jgi:hypothetical protein